MNEKIKVDLDSYNKKGFVLLEDFYSQDLIQRFNVCCSTYLGQYLTNFGFSTEDVLHTGFRLLDKTDHKIIHNFYNIIRNSDILFEFKHSKKVYSVIKQLLNMDESQMVYNMYGISRMDPPDDGRFLYKWHQESYYTIPGSDSVQLWAPLVDKSSQDNGTIDVLIGSHLEEVPHHIERVPNGHEQKYIEDNDIKTNYELLKIEIKPGDALFFHPLLIHKSNNNIGNRVRYSLVSHYLNPYSVNIDFEQTDPNYSEFHRKRCVNYNSYVSYNK